MNTIETATELKVAENKKSKNEIIKEVELKINAEKAKTLAEWQELQKDKKLIGGKRERVMSEIDKRYPDKGSSERYKDSLWDRIRLFDSQLSFLEQVQKEMLYENYFLKHSKGIVEGKTPSGEYWDDKYYYDIRDILGKWYRKCMSGVNDFHLGYEGASDNDIDQDYNEGGISTSTWGFIGDYVYKIIREMSEPRLHFRNFEGRNNGYHGILYRNLYDWRKQKSSVKSVKENIK